MAIWSDLERPESGAVLLCDDAEVAVLETEFESVSDAEGELVVTTIKLAAGGVVVVREIVADVEVIVVEVEVPVGYDVF